MGDKPSSHQPQQKRQQDDRPDQSQLTFYPAYCYRMSPTYRTWVKIRAVDLYRLTTRPGETNVFFFRNHPIQYFCLAGILLSRDDYPSRTNLVLDDCSGVTIEIVCSKKKVKVVLDNDNDDDDDNADNDDYDDDGDAGKQHRDYSTTFTGDKSLTSATSTITTQHITASTSSPIDISPLQPCKRVKVKGTLSVLSVSRYMPTTNGDGSRKNGGSGLATTSPSDLPPMDHTRFRLDLDRFQILPDLPAEIRFWNERTRIFSEVLCAPWRLCDEEVQDMKKRAEKDALEKEKRAIRERIAQQRGIVQSAADAQRVKEERAGRRAQKDMRDRDRIGRRWEKEEVLRDIAAEKVKQVNRKFEERLKSSRASKRTEKAEPV